MPDAEEFLYKPSTGTFEPHRTPEVFKIAGAVQSSGNQALWAPAAGKKFRLLGVGISFGSNLSATSAADLVVGVLDAGTPIWRFRIFVPAAAAGTGASGQSLIWTPPSNGYLSTAINQTLNLNLSFSLTGTGAIDMMAWGTEE